MGFKLAVIAPRKSSSGSGLKVSLTKARNNPARMNFTIPADIASRLGWTGGDKLRVLIGTGSEHHGLIRIGVSTKDVNATLIERFANHAKTKYYAINLGQQPDFVDRAEHSTLCQYRLTENVGEIEITLPKWAYETNTKVTRQEHVIGQRPHPEPSASKPNTPLTAPIMERRGPGRPPGSGKAVTGAIMGDPPQPATRSGIMDQLSTYKG